MHINRALNSIILPYKKTVYEKLEKSFYVDDCVTSVNSYSDFEVFRREACSLLTQAEFDLRDWKYTGKDPESQSTVLGPIWDTKRDILMLPEFPAPTITEKITKRVILSQVQKLGPSRIHLSHTVKTKITIARSVE